MTDAREHIQGVSDEAVKAATGRTWPEWFEILDAAGAMKLPHKDIARWLYDNHLKKGWWCQSITVSYEKARGLRVLGQTADTGFQLGVQKSLPLSSNELWDFLLSPAGLPIWLGETKPLQLTKGSVYETTDGIKGEVRSVDPGTKLRITWQPVDWPRSSTVQLYLLPTAEGTSLRIHHEKLADQKIRTHMLKHWRKILGNITAYFEHKAK